MINLASYCCLRVFFKIIKYHFYVAGLLIILIGLATQDASGQLLEERKGRLKSIRSEKPGFLFFKRKIRTVDPDNSKKSGYQVPHLKSEAPANFNKNPKPVKTRTTKPVSYNKKDVKVNVKTSTPVSYNKKDRFTGVRTSAPVSYNKKDVKVNVRTSTPVSYSKKDRFTGVRTSAPVSYNKKDVKINVRTSTPVSYNKKDRFTGVRTSLPVSYSRKDQKVNVKYSKPQKETYFNFWITEQMKSKRRIGPGEDSNDLYGKRKFSLKSPFVYRKNLTISGPMNYTISKRTIEQNRIPNDFTNRYQGDIKRDRNPILHLKYRFGQWERASYRGHHIGLTKYAKEGNDRFNSLTISKHQGDTRVFVPFLSNLIEKMKVWEQTHYQGRSDGPNKFGQRDFDKQQSILVSNFEGDIKVKRRKGGDMHPSIVYISGKRFASTNWKERWRKLNILWVRLNPGKETPDGPKEKVKIKPDKDERDIWTY